ncbi:hypothetical protein BH09ACT5_BH09ACT5_01200 [soil metagenome]
MERCRACNSARVDELNAAIVAGVTPLLQLSGMYHLSYSSVRRHAANHISDSILVVPQAGPTGRPTDLLQRYMRALEDADSVREFAVTARRPDLLLRASKETRAAVEYLLDHLGITGTEMIEQLARGDAYAEAMTDLIRRSPRFGLALAAQLEENDQSEMAASVKSYATFRQNAIDQQKEAS